MKKLRIFASASVCTIMMSGCGGDSSPPNYSNPPVAGHYGKTTLINGYKVANEIVVKPNGDFLGLAFNTLETNQPDMVYTILKGNMNSSSLREFDLINQGINIYTADSDQQNNNTILFKFSKIPSTLIRPEFLKVSRLATTNVPLYTLVGYYDSITIGLTGTYASTIDVRNTTDAAILKLVYLDTQNCQINAFIEKMPYQTDLIDVKGVYSGINCPYNGQEFLGLIGYDYTSNVPVLFGATSNNSTAFVTAPKP